MGLLFGRLPDVSFTLEDLGKHLGESGEGREEVGGSEGGRTGVPLWSQEGGWRESVDAGSGGRQGVSREGVQQLWL